MKFLKLFDMTPWVVIIFLCGTIGLAPFSPPHVVEKTVMLLNGNLVKPIDWFDLFFHGFPWILFILKAVSAAIIKGIEN